MYQSGFVRLAQRARDVRDDLLGDLRGQPLLAIQTLAEALAHEPLHHDEGHLLVDSVVQDLDHMRATKRGRSLRLVHEALGQTFVLGRWTDDLDRHLRAEHQVMGEPHRPHAPFSDDGAELVLAAENAAWLQWMHHLGNASPPD